MRAIVMRTGPWLLVAPAIAFMLIFCAYPLLRLFILSLGPSGISPANYIRLFTSGTYLTVLRNTLLVSSGVTVICLAAGYPVAYALSQLISPAWQRRLIVLVVIPYLTSQLVRIYAWKVLLGDQGPINQALAALRVTEEPLPLLYSLTGMLIGMTHIMLPLMILPLYATMRGINPALKRAATAMGAGPLRTFVSVFLPLSMPGVRSGCVLVFVTTLGTYIIPSALGGLSNSMISNLIQTQVESSLNFGLAGAAAFVLLALTLVVFALVGGEIGAVYGSGETISTRRSPAIRRARLIFGAVGKLSGLSQLCLSVSSALWRKRQSNPPTPSHVGRTAILGATAAVLGFLAIPSLIVVVISFSADSFLAFPPARYSLRWYEVYLQSPQWRSATMLSLVIAPLSAVLSLLLGLGAAYALVRGQLAGRRAILGLLLAPLIIPSVVSGIAIFWLLADWRLVGTQVGILIAHTIGGLAFVVVITMSALANFDRRLELAAMSLGARPLTMFRKIVAPLIMPGIVAGALFAFIHSFDEVIITSFVAGTQHQTLPVKIWSDMVLEVDPTIAAVSALLVALPFLWLIVMEGFGQRRERMPKVAQSIRQAG